MVDRGDDRAVGGGGELLPEDRRRCRGRAVDGAHPDVRLARGRGGDEDGCAPGAEAGGGCRGPGDRGRLRLQAVQGGARDVHEPRGGRRADRRQRRLPARSRRPVSRRPAGGLAAGRGRAGRSPQAVRDRRCGRVDGRRWDRGPLRERRLSRRDGAGHRRRRPAGAGGVPDELPRPRCAATVRTVLVLPGAGRARLDAHRARAGDPRRARGRLAGDPGADRRRSRAPRRDEPLPHRPGHDRPDRGRRTAWRACEGRGVESVQQRPGDGRAEAPLPGHARRGCRGVGASGDRRPREGRRRRRRRQLRHGESRRVGALPQLGDHDARPERGGSRAHRGEALRTGHRPVQPRRAAHGLARALRSAGLEQARLPALRPTRS